MPAHIYRVIKGAQAIRDDFLSDGARRKRVRHTATDALIRRQGFSAWLTDELPIGATLLPFPDTPGHQTAFGDPDAFVQAVVRIVPVN